MQPFERIAILTMIEGIEGQLRGLKGLLAASMNASPQTHKVTDTLGTTGDLTEDEEARLARELELDRENRIKGLKKQGEEVFLSELVRATGGIAPQVPGGTDMSELNG